MTINHAIDEILHYLEDIPLSSGTVRYYTVCYQAVLGYCSKNKLSLFSYEDAEGFYVVQTERVNRKEICNTYALIMRKAAFTLAEYLATGNVCWNRRNYKGITLPEQYQQLLDRFQAYIAESLAEGSVDLVIHMCKRFLFFLIEKGCQDISALNVFHVKEFIRQESPRHISHKINLTWPVKKFLHYLNDYSLTEINADFFLANPVPSRRKVLPCLEEAEVEALFSKVDRNSIRGKRDYAIMKLALETGLRWSDISSLKLSEIDWRKKEISLLQEKTDTALVLPLTVEAGNAVADYILNARPKIDSPYIFLRLRRPYDRLGSRTPAANIMERYQSESGFIHRAGDGKSFHAFRRTMGTRLIKADVPLPTVSQILGHNSLDSTKRYLSLHDEKLLSCCMDPGMFPCRKEGLV